MCMLRACRLPLSIKSLGTVMLFLIANVVGNGIQPRWANGKGAVGSLPFEKLIGSQLMSDEVGRTTFDLFDQRCDRHGRRISNKEVNMIVDTTNRDRITPYFLAIVGDGGIDRVTDINRQKRQTIPRGPNTMSVEFSVGRSHRR